MVKQAWFLRSLIMTVIAAGLVAFSFSATGLTAAKQAPAENHYVQVTDDGLVKYLLDANTVQRHTGLSGQSLTVVWIEGRIASGAGSYIEAFLGATLRALTTRKLGQSKQDICSGWMAENLIRKRRWRSSKDSIVTKRGISSARTDSILLLLHQNGET